MKNNILIKNIPKPLNSHFKPLCNRIFLAIAE
jgi:hypothetical protein